MPPSSPTFGQYLRYLRRKARITQTELSIAVGYSTGQISYLENGQRVPDPATVAALFPAALGIEQDPDSISQLVRLAQLAQNRPGESEIQTELVVERQELGFLEEVPPLPSAMVARPDELAQLQVTLAQSRWAAVVGLAGMGKSTLAAAIASEHATRGPVCWVSLGAASNLSHEDVLRQLALYAIAHNTEMMAQSALHQLLQSHKGDTKMSLARQMSVLINALNALKQPLIVLDDAHTLRNDDQLWPILQRLHGQCQGLCFLATSREALPLAQIPHITLGGLRSSQVTMLVHALFTQAQSQQPINELAAQSVAQFNGNPLLIRLLCSQLQVDMAVPMAQQITARYIVENVLQTLSPSAHHLLAFLALWRGVLNVLGSALAQSLAEIVPAYQHADAIVELQRRCLIDVPAQASLHVVIREPMQALLGQMPETLNRLHRAAAQYARRKNNVVEAAHHWLRAGDVAAACAAIQGQVSAIADRGQSNAAAVVLREIDDALALALTVQPDAQAMRCTALQLRADVLANTARVSEAQADYRAALGMLVDPLQRAQVTAKLILSLNQSSAYAEALALCRSALNALRELEKQHTGSTTQALSAQVIPALRLRLELQATRLQTLLFQGRYQAAERQGRRLLAQIKRSPSDSEWMLALFQIRADCHMTLGYVARLRGDIATAKRHSLRAIKFARAAHNQDAEVRALMYAGLTLRQLGESMQAEVLSEQSLQLARQRHNPFLLSEAQQFRALNHYYSAETHDCIALAAESLRIKEALGDASGVAAAAALLSLAYREQGQLDEATHYAQRARHESEMAEMDWLRGVSGYVDGVLALCRGDIATALHSLKTALALPEFALDRDQWVQAYVALGMAHLCMGDEAAAQAIAQDESVLVGAARGARLSQQLLQALCARAQGQHNTAIEIAREVSLSARASHELFRAGQADRLIQALTLVEPEPLPKVLARIFGVAARTTNHQ